MYRLVITRWNSALVCVKDTEMSLGTNPERGVIQDLSMMVRVAECVPMANSGLLKD